MSFGDLLYGISLLLPGLQGLGRSFSSLSQMSNESSHIQAPLKEYYEQQRTNLVHLIRHIQSLNQEIEILERCPIVNATRKSELLIIQNYYQTKLRRLLKEVTMLKILLSELLEHQVSQ